MTRQSVIRIQSLLRTAFVFFAVVFLAALAKPKDDSKPLIGRRFDVQNFRRSLDIGKLVFVFGNPFYHVEGVTLKAHFATPAVTKAIRSANADPFYLEYKSWYDKDVDDLFEQTRRIKESIVVFLKKEQQPRYFDCGTRDEVIEYLRENR